MHLRVKNSRGDFERKSNGTTREQVFEAYLAAEKDVKGILSIPCRAALEIQAGQRQCQNK